MCAKMQESGLTGTIPLLRTSAVWGQSPVFSCPELALVRSHRGGVAGGSRLLGSRCCFPYHFPWRSPAHTRALQSRCWLWHPCFLTPWEGLRSLAPRLTLLEFALRAHSYVGDLLWFPPLQVDSGKAGDVLGQPCCNSATVLLLKKRAGRGFRCPCLLHSQNTPTACRSRELRRTWTPGAWSEPVAPLRRWAACSVGMSWEPEGQSRTVRTPKLCKPSAPWRPPPVLQHQRNRGFTEESSRRPGRNHKWPRELIGISGHEYKEAEAWGSWSDVTARPSLSLHSQRSLPLQPQLLQEPVNPVLKWQCSRTGRKNQTSGELAPFELSVGLE